MEYPKSPFMQNPLVEQQIIECNPSKISELLEWLCQTPQMTTYRVNLLKTTTNAFKSHLQNVLDEKYANPPIVHEMADIPELLYFSQLQLPPPTACSNAKDGNSLKQIIVDCCCGAALLRGAHVFAPGVLAMETGTKLGEQVEVYADVMGQCRRGTNIRYNCAAKIFIGIGVARMQRHQLFKNYSDTLAAAHGIAIEMQLTTSLVPSIGDLSANDDVALLQNLPSIICVRCLAPQTGQRILDMCAAPGNKTTHIAELIQDKGLIVALDKAASRIKCIDEKIVARKLRCIKTFAFDATKAHDANKSIELGEPPFASATFERILLDAPCSALGNRPLLMCKMTPKMLKSYPHVQRKLFATAVQLLKPSGILVYSTCTVTEAENECLVAWALAKYKELELLEVTPKFGGPGLPNTGLDEIERHKVQRFGPTGTQGVALETVGFFIAKFRKKYKES